MTFNLSSTQFYLFFSSFRIKNYKLCDQLPPPDFYASLDKERHFRPSKLTLQIKSLHNILPDQILWMMEQQKQELQGQKSRHWQSRWSFFRNAFVRVWWYNFSHRRALPQAWLRGWRATMRPLPCLWNNPDVKPCAGCVPWLWYKFSHTEEGAPPPLAGGALGVLPSAESSCSGIWERASCAEASCLSCEGGGCRAGNGPTPVWRHHHTSFKRTSHEVSPFLM